MTDSKNSLKLQLQVDSTTRHILDELIDVRGRSRADVTYFVIRQWISEHRQELMDLGIVVNIPGGQLKITDETRRQE